MRLTLRGWTVAGVAGLAIVFALTFGQDGLNAVAAPLLGAVAYGAVSVWRADPPRVTMAGVQPGFPGEQRRISIDVAGDGVLAVDHAWPAGLDAAPLDALVSPQATLGTDVTLATRGVHRLGVLGAWHRDPLGLVEAPAAVDLEEPVVVYPRVYRTAAHGALSPLLADEHRVERQVFDSLREYRPGDPLRRIHWKSSAKHDDFLVTEFDDDSRTESLTIAADAEPGTDDDMATAVGTVALQALQAGLEVGLDLPGESVPPGSGDAHRANLFGVLARVGHGTVPPERHTAADVSIRADRQRTSIDAGGQPLSLDELTAGPDTHPVREVAQA